jgi:putative ABC transport system permease protein
VTAAPSADWRLAAILVTFVALAAFVSHRTHLDVAREEVVTAVRAVVQLSLIALALNWVLHSLGLSATFVVLMFCVATVTASFRVGVRWRGAPWMALSIGAGAAPVIGLCLASGVIPLRGPGVIPLAGIVIGGTMIAAVLAGRRAFQELRTQVDIHHAALALGAPPKAAANLVINPTAREALLPTLDQTRTVGLVALPGTFVGVILGGGSAIDAGASQLLVLIGLLPAQVITTAVIHWLIATERVKSTLSAA